MKLDPRNPFYGLLILVSTAFAVTAFAYAFVPWDNQPMWLREHGWQLLLVEVAGVIVLGLASMGMDSFLLRANRKQT
jgi:hypothetical protein